MKKLVSMLLTACLVVGTTGCIVSTTGEASWEVYGGVRTMQHDDGEAAKVEIKSSIVDSLIDGEISKAE